MSAVDDFASCSPTPEGPYSSVEPVTKGVEFSHVSCALYIGTGGDLEVVMADGTSAVFRNLPNASLLRIRAKQVLNSGAVANILSLR